MIGLNLFSFLFYAKKAEKALKYYKGYKGGSSEEDMAILKEFEKLKAIVSEQKQEPKLRLADFCTYLWPSTFDNGKLPNAMFQKI